MADDKQVTMDDIREHTREGEPTFAEYESKLGDDDSLSPYAVEGNDVSGFVGVSPEYRTYVGDGNEGSTEGFDPTVADNSQEKLDALAEQDGSGDASDSSDDSSDSSDSTPKKAPAKKASTPPIS